MHPHYLFRILIVTGLIFSYFAIPTRTVAMANSNSATAFSVTPILPADNDPQIPYFQFSMPPRQIRTLKLTINNTSHQTGQYDVVPHIASTNTNGILDYGHDNRCSQLPEQATDLFDPDITQVVQVPAMSSKIVKVRLKAPAQTFKGIMLAGITVGVHHPATTGKNKPLAGIVAAAEYVTAIEFYSQSSKRHLSPKLRFNHVQYRLAQAQPKLVLAINNQAPSITSQGTLTAKLLDKEGHPVNHFQKDQLTFAPQNQFNLNLDLNNQQLRAGHYRLIGNLTTHGGVNHHFSLPLTVTPQATTTVRQHAAHYASQAFPNWIMYILVAIIAAIIGAVSRPIWRRVRRLLGMRHH